MTRLDFVKDLNALLVETLHEVESLEGVFLLRIGPEDGQGLRVRSSFIFSGNSSKDIATYAGVLSEQTEETLAAMYTVFKEAEDAEMAKK